MNSPKSATSTGGKSAAGWASLVLLGILTGFLSGLVGIGGGLLMIPILTLVFGKDQKLAQAISLSVVLVTAVVGATTYAFDGHLQIGAAVALSVGGVLGSYSGAALLPRFKASHLQAAFGVLAVGTAALMFFDVAAQTGTLVAETSLLSISMLVVAGFGAGALAGLLGVGGGVVMVPLMVLALGFSQHEAQATSLFVIIFVSLVAVIKNRRNRYSDFRSSTWIAIGSVLVTPLGASVAIAADANTVQNIFAGFLVVVAVLMWMRAQKRDRTTKPPKEWEGERTNV